MIRRTGHGAWFTESRILGDAMRDVIDRIIARHILFLQEVGGVTFAFRKNRDQHVRAGHFGPTRGLHMDRRTLDHPLERCRWHRFGAVNIGDQIVQVFIDKFDQRFAQFGHIDGTGFHHLHGVGFVDQGQKEMFKRSEFMFARIGKGQRRVNGLF